MQSILPFRFKQPYDKSKGTKLLYQGTYTLYYFLFKHYDTSNMIFSASINNEHIAHPN